MLKIQKATVREVVVFTLSGRIKAEDVAELQRLFEDEADGHRMVLVGWIALATGRLLTPESPHIPGVFHDISEILEDSRALDFSTNAGVFEKAVWALHAARRAARYGDERRPGRFEHPLALSASDWAKLLSTIVVQGRKDTFLFSI